MSSYLEPGERVRLEARPHGAALARPLTRALGLSGLGGAVLVAGASVAWPIALLGAVGVAAGALLALAAVLRWDRTLLVVTTEKLLVVYGVLRRRSASVRLAHAGALQVDQTLAGRLLGYGTVFAGELEVPYVPDVRELTRSV